MCKVLWKQKKKRLTPLEEVKDRIKAQLTFAVVPEEVQTVVRRGVRSFKGERVAHTKLMHITKHKDSKLAQV